MRRFSLILFALTLLFARLSAQTMPEVDIPITSHNYFEICTQLDAHFAEEGEEASETECWDNEWVKYQRWKWFWRDRVNSDGSFPDLKAQWLEARQSKASVAQSRNAQPTWNSEGPNEIANGGGYWGMGRTKHVAFHPTDPLTLFVGTPDGGLWKTADFGNNWTSLGENLPYLPVSVILIDYLHPDTMYISLGDKGGWWMRNLGVYKSTDGGQNWAPTGLDWALNDFNVIYNMVMSPTDPQVIFAATNTGLRRTTDGGVTWTTLQTGEYTDVKYRPNDPTTLYAAHHDYWGKSQLIKTTDGGETWTQISDFQESQNELKLCVSPAAPDWVGLRFSQGHKFYLSKDAGATFEYKSDMPEDAHFSFSPRDTNIVYTSGVVVHRSMDQGATWSAITHWYNDGIHAEVHADVHDIVINPYNTEELWFCNDGGLYQYYEPWETWQDLSSGLSIAQFYRIAISEQGPMRLIAGSQDNGGWMRRPNNSWVHTNGGDAMCQLIDPNNSSIMFTEYYGGNAIYRSTDGWLTNVTISDNLPDDPSGDWVTPFIFNPQNTKTMLFGFHDVYRTFDRGDHYDKISQNLTGSVDNKIRDIAMAASDSNFIVATWSNIVYKTTNAGQTWTAKTVSTDEGISRIIIHPGNTQQMWVCKGGYLPGKKVWRTVNGGLSWQNISYDLPNVPVNCILYDSITNYLFIGTDIGVYYSESGSTHWEPYGQGMPNVYVLDLQLRNTSRVLYAGTHGRGVYSVALEEVVPTTTPSLESSDIVVFPNPAQNALFFKTNGEDAFSGQIILRDALGRTLIQQSLQTAHLSQNNLDLSRISNGVYFLTLQSNGLQGTVVKKVIIQK